jgi:hypothetical protein
MESSVVYLLTDSKRQTVNCEVNNQTSEHFLLLWCYFKLTLTPGFPLHSILIQTLASTNGFVCLNCKP